MLVGLGRVVGNRQTWLIAIAGLGTTGPLLGFAGLWGVPYFVATLGIDRTAAASITSMMFVGWGVGAPLIGWISDRIGRRRIPYIVRARHLHHRDVGSPRLSRPAHPGADGTLFRLRLRRLVADRRISPPRASTIP